MIKIRVKLSYEIGYEEINKKAMEIEVLGPVAAVKIRFLV
jgi:hypothetical protein